MFESPADDIFLVKKRRSLTEGKSHPCSAYKQHAQKAMKPIAARKRFISMRSHTAKCSSAAGEDL